MPLCGVTQGSTKGKQGGPAMLICKNTRCKSNLSLFSMEERTHACVPGRGIWEDRGKERGSEREERGSEREAQRDGWSVADGRREDVST